MPETRVGVIGAGYVGLTTAVCLASLGHPVHCTDIDTAKVAALNRGRTTLDEPDLSDLLVEGLAGGRLAFGTDPAALGDAEVVLLCLPTPMSADGGADLGAVHAALDRLGGLLAPDAVLVTKSTVPVGTTDRLAARLDRADVAVVSNPEFLREGHTVADFLHPSRILVGAHERRAGDRVAALYAQLAAPVVRTDPASAELAKYASNAFLAMKASYVNGLAELSERVGADIADVAATMGLDDRIGPAFLAPGPGWGGPCLPKDVSALVHAGRGVGLDLPLLRETLRANETQRRRVLDKIGAAVGGPLHGVRIGLLGLTFKAGTADVRDSPALAVAGELARRGAVLTGYDPAARAEDLPPRCPVQLVDDPYLVAKDAAAVVVLTEWPEFRALDWPRMAALAEQPAVVDTRDVLDRAALTGAGWSYRGIGRSAQPPAPGTGW